MYNGCTVPINRRVFSTSTVYYSTCIAAGEAVASSSKEMRARSGATFGGGASDAWTACSGNRVYMDQLASIRCASGRLSGTWVKYWYVAARSRLRTSRPSRRCEISCRAESATRNDAA